MIPPTLIDRQVAEQNAIGTLAHRILLTVWRQLDTADARAATDLLLALTRDITVVYGELAAVSAADWYDEVRRETQTPGRFRASPSRPVPADQSDAMVRWAVAPLWAADPSRVRTLLRLAAGTARLVRKPARDTVAENAGREGIRYARQPQSGACAFCLMLATRDDYTSERAASVVGDRPRGTRSPGEQFHDNCRCQPVPIRLDSDFPDINRRLRDEWDQVTAGQSDQWAAWLQHVESRR